MCRHFCEICSKATAERKLSSVITLAFLLCIPLTLVLFARMQVELALIWSVLLTYMFLPERAGFDFRGIPALDKTSIPALALILAVLIFGGRKRTIRHGVTHGGQDPSDRVVGDRVVGAAIGCLLVMMLLSPIFTTFTNGDSLRFGPLFLQGARPWDIVGQSSEVVFILVPYVLARRYLSTPEAHRRILVALVAAGLVYSVFALVEIRLSPQLHNWVYGFHQHSFLQHIRGGEFRPKIFLDHGLSVGLFLSMTTIAAAVLMRGRDRNRKWVFAGLWLFLILFNSKNLGAVMITLALVPVLFLPVRWQLRVTTVIAVSFLLFPALRQSGIVPIERLTAVAEAISPDRAQSLVYRFDNEDILLARSLERPVFGWGGWGRSRVYDTTTGEDLSTTDGLWIIKLGTSGWFGYVAFFGLLVLPMVALHRTGKRKGIGPETAGLAIMMAGTLIYLVPNSTLSPVAWLMVGALAGFAQFDTQKTHSAEDIPPQVRKSRGPRYSRFETDIVRSRLGGAPAFKGGQQTR